MLASPRRRRFGCKSVGVTFIQTANVNVSEQRIVSRGPLHEVRRTMVIMRSSLFGGTADGDADRNMILSAQFFVSPSDSLAMMELGIYQ